MAQAKTGDKVRVNYTGSLKEEGTTFDSTEEEPFEFTLGEDRVISGFEKAVIGMEEGETETVSISSEDAYGPHIEDNIITIDPSQLPSNIDPQVGMMLQLRTDEGKTTNAIITDITDEEVTLDGNHPLAGNDLVFEIELVEII